MDGSMARLRASGCALLLVALLGQAACGSDDSAGELTPTPTATSAAEPSPEPTEAPVAQAVPEELVGTWVSDDEGAAEFVYVFSADGTYKHAGVLLQQRESGTFSFTVEARGTVSVDGDQLVLEPESGKEELSDPDRPGGPEESPIDMTPQRYEWALADSRLTLTDESGSTIGYRPE
jgi:hypothetical protein